MYPCTNICIMSECGRCNNNTKLFYVTFSKGPTPPPSPAPSSLCQPQTGAAPGCSANRSSSGVTKATTAAVPINIPTVSGSSASRIPESTSVISPDSSSSSSSVAAAIQDIKEAIQRTKTLPRQPPSSHVEPSRPSPLTSSSQSHAADGHNSDTSPVWVPRYVYVLCKWKILLCLIPFVVVCFVYRCNNTLGRQVKKCQFWLRPASSQRAFSLSFLFSFLLFSFQLILSLVEHMNSGWCK